MHQPNIPWHPCYAKSTIKRWYQRPWSRTILTCPLSTRKSTRKVMRWFPRVKEWLQLSYSYIIEISAGFQLLYSFWKSPPFQVQRFLFSKIINKLQGLLSSDPLFWGPAFLHLRSQLRVLQDLCFLIGLTMHGHHDWEQYRRNPWVGYKIDLKVMVLECSLLWNFSFVKHWNSGRGIPVPLTNENLFIFGKVPVLNLHFPMRHWDAPKYKFISSFGFTLRSGPLQMNKDCQWLPCDGSCFEWLTDWLNKWIRKNKRMNERMNEWTNEWTDERTNEWMTEWANE